MLRRISVRIIAALAVLALALPLTAGLAAAKNSPDQIKTDVQLLNPATLNGLQLQPGTYTLTADSTQVKFIQHGKVVAMAPITWVDQPSKSAYTAVVVTDNAVQKIFFSGKTRYVAISR
ncbi:MAG TPA: hypothetical protein VMJ93_02650 [Verrucomicrobiae bacterium]|nr:hypothetical protein [Verrucomicrobiae bacterium]